MGTIPDPSPMEQTLRATMRKIQGNGYDPANEHDADIMSKEAAAEADTLLKFWKDPQQVTQALQERLAAIKAARAAISSGDPKAFSGEGLDPGYYFSDKSSPTGSALMAPGASTWNPNKAQMNQAIREKVFTEALRAMTGKR
jgi:ABC-type Fe3+-hydroxamate transport system substrate-binding protein